MQHSRVTVVAVGDFGRAVAARLATRITGTHVIEDAAQATSGPVRPIVLASWREAPAVARAIDASDAVPWWLPVIMTHPRIRVGPALGQGVPGCYDCLLGRELAADEQPHLTSALWDRYDRDPSAGPLGHLDHHVGIAAALAAMFIGDGDPPRRRVVSYDVLAGTLRTDQFVPFHDCPRWSRGRPLPLAPPAEHATPRVPTGSPA